MALRAGFIAENALRSVVHRRQDSAYLLEYGDSQVQKKSSHSNLDMIQPFLSRSQLSSTMALKLSLNEQRQDATWSCSDLPTIALENNL